MCTIPIILSVITHQIGIIDTFQNTSLNILMSINIFLFIVILIRNWKQFLKFKWVQKRKREKRRKKKSKSTLTNETEYNVYMYYWHVLKQKKFGRRRWNMWILWTYVSTPDKHLNRFSEIAVWMIDIMP